MLVWVLCDAGVMCCVVLVWGVVWCWCGVLCDVGGVCDVGVMCCVMLVWVCCVMLVWGVV